MPRGKGTCGCGCGQAPAKTTRLRKASCGCGQSIIRLSRQSIGCVNASCIACGGPIEPLCLYDRAVSHDAADAADAIAALERADLAFAERSAQYAARKLGQMRCGNEACRSFRAFGAGCDPTHPEPCERCGSTLPATFGHRRATPIVAVAEAF